MHDDTGQRVVAVLHPAEEGGFWAEIPTMPGCATQAESVEELLALLRDAASGWLACSTDFAEASSVDINVELRSTTVAGPASIHVHREGGCDVS